MDPQRASPTPALTRPAPDLAPVIRLVTDAVTSPHTRRAYARALGDFLTWYRAQAAPRLSKAVVQAYVADLREQGVPAASLNQRLTALRKFAYEAADNGLVDPATAQAIARVEGVRRSGQRLGAWLTQAEAQALLRLPDVTTVKGLRDRALLAVLLGCGLRRGGHVQEGALSAQAVFGVVRVYAEELGVQVRPHDLRRTFAKLAHQGGAPLEQIQLSLGHSSLLTTERYLGVAQDLTTAPCDVLGLRL